MKFLIEETGKKISIAVIEKESGQDILAAVEGLLNKNDNGVDICDLPVKSGRIIIKEKYVSEILYVAEALLGDTDDCYIKTWGM